LVSLAAFGWLAALLLSHAGRAEACTWRLTEATSSLLPRGGNGVVPRNAIITFKANSGTPTAQVQADGTSIPLSPVDIAGLSPGILAFRAASGLLPPDVDIRLGDGRLVHSAPTDWSASFESWELLGATWVAGYEEPAGGCGQTGCGPPDHLLVTFKRVDGLERPEPVWFHVVTAPEREGLDAAQPALAFLLAEDRTEVWPGGGPAYAALEEGWWLRFIPVNAAGETGQPLPDVQYAPTDQGGCHAITARARLGGVVPLAALAALAWRRAHRGRRRFA